MNRFAPGFVALFLVSAFLPPQRAALAAGSSRQSPIGQNQALSPRASQQTLQSWKRRIDGILAAPVTDMSFFSDSNPAWAGMPKRRRVALAGHLGSQASSFQKTHQALSTSIPQDRALRMLVSRLLIPGRELSALGEHATTDRVKTVYARYLKEVSTAAGISNPFTVEEVLARARVIQRALSSKFLSHEAAPAAYAFGSIPMGWGRRGESDWDVVYANDYFGSYVNRGLSGSWVKAELDHQIRHQLSAVDGRPFYLRELFDGASTSPRPTAFAVTSPLMIKIERNQISLTIFPQAYKKGAAGSSSVFEVDLASKPALTWRLE